MAVVVVASAGRCKESEDRPASSRACAKRRTVMESEASVVLEVIEGEATLEASGVSGACVLRSHPCRAAGREWVRECVS